MVQQTLNLKNLNDDHKMYYESISNSELGNLITSLEQEVADLMQGSF